MKDEVERGDRIERGVAKESRNGFVVVKETATVIVCMRLVSLKVVEHFSCLLKIMFTSLVSGFTSLSIWSLRRCRSIFVMHNLTHQGGDANACWSVLQVQKFRVAAELYLLFSFEEDHVTGSLVLETMDNSSS